RMMKVASAAVVIASTFLGSLAYADDLLASTRSGDAAGWIDRALVLPRGTLQPTLSVGISNLATNTALGSLSGESSVSEPNSEPAIACSLDYWRISLGAGQCPIWPF